MEDRHLEFNVSAAVAFGTNGCTTMVTTAGEVVTCYLVGEAWGRLPALPQWWTHRLPRNLIPNVYDEYGQLRQVFSERKPMEVLERGIFTFCAVEVNEGNCVCETCGSEFFFVFRDVNGTATRLDRLTVLESMVRLSELGHIPTVHDQLIFAWRYFYDHIRVPEHACQHGSGGAHGHL